MKGPKSPKELLDCCHEKFQAAYISGIYLITSSCL